MPRGRAWQHSDDLSHQVWLKVLQGKRPPAEKWPRQSGAPKPVSHQSNHSPRFATFTRMLEAVIAAVGDEDETAPKLKEALRKARTIFGQSPQECVEGARGSLQGTAASDGSTEQPRTAGGRG